MSHEAPPPPRVICGDARLLAAAIREPCVVISDPPWPNLEVVPGSEDVPALLAAVLAPLIGVARRLVLVFGCTSDPRVLAAVPAVWPFVRACWLKHLIPTRRGTILHGSDVAYVFGDHRATRPRRVLPGEHTHRDTTSLRHEGGGWHPCPRRLSHMLWLVDHFSAPGELVVDPFAGSATTGLAAMRQGRRFLGFEIVPDWAERAQRRLEAETRFSSYQAEASGQGALFAVPKVLP